MDTDLHLFGLEPPRKRCITDENRIMGGTESDCNHRARKVQDRTPAVTMAPEMACIGPEMADFWTVTILKPSQLKAKTGAILDEAIHSPQYVERDGTLL